VRRRAGLFFASWLVSGAWLGCNLILGNESAVFVPGESGTSDDGSARDGGSDASQPDDGSFPDGAEDAGPCTDLATNARHCGACFHDCLGGQCVGGICQPVEIATDESGPFAIAVDATHVYWTNRESGDLWRVPIAGGTKERLFDGPENSLGDEIAVHDGLIYFPHQVGDAGVVRCPVSGCPNSGPEPVVENGTMATAVTIEDGVLLFVESAVGGRIGRCPLPCNGTFEIVASGEMLPLRAAQSGNVVAWSVITNDVRIKVGDAGPISVPTNNGFATGIAVSGGLVYAEEHNVGPLVMPTDGGPRQRLTASTFSFSEELAVDEANVYFTDTTDNGRVMRCARTGCGDSGVPLATNQSRPRGIAVDAKSVYWVNSGGADGHVMRVAK
jgi:hypothetical protein